MHNGEFLCGCVLATSVQSAKTIHGFSNKLDDYIDRKTDVKHGNFDKM